jgi:hypothetical protein
VFFAVMPQVSGPEAFGGGLPFSSSRIKPRSTSFYLKHMKTSLKTLFVAAATFVALGTTSCSEKQQDNAETTAENAATSAGNAVEGAVTPDSDGANTVAPENGDTAVVRNQPANGVVEETPVKK